MWRKMSKVWAVTWFVLLVVSAMVFAAPAKEVPKVVTILVQGGSESHTFAQETAAEFKELTGYEVNIVAVPYEGLYDKMTAETVSPQSSYDVACVDFLWLPAWAHKLVPLDDLLTPDVRADLFEVSIAGGTYKGKFYGMPTWESCKVLMYRTDLFGDEKEKQAFKRQYGYELAPPKNWQEYIDVARFFTRDSNNDGVIDLYGTYVGGAPHEDNACSWFDFALQAGADWLVVDDSGKVVVDSQPYVDALAFMGDQLNKYKVAPPGALEMLCVQGAELFQDGKLAMMLNWPFAYRMAQDPSGSKVVGKVDSRPMIAGSKGVGVTTGTWINIIPASSKNVDIAKKYIKFWYDRDNILFRLTGEAARKSTFVEYENKAGYETVGPLLTSLAAPRSKARPLLVKYQQVSSEAMLPALQSVLNRSRTPAEAAKWAAAKVAEIIK